MTEQTTATPSLMCGCTKSNRRYRFCKGHIEWIKSAEGKTAEKREYDVVTLIDRYLSC